MVSLNYYKGVFIHANKYRLFLFHKRFIIINDIIDTEKTNNLRENTDKYYIFTNIINTM